MLTLYQFNSCPFCWKIKALLHLTKTAYQVVEVTPFSMKELDFTTHKKVPVLRDGELIIVESNTIALHILTHYSALPAMTERGNTWMQWVDNTLVHYLPPLIHASWWSSFKNFQHILVAGQFGIIKQFGVRLAGSFVMPKVARKMKAKHNIQNTEAEFNTALSHWEKEGLEGKPFFEGETPGVVDAMVYGVLRSCAKMPFWQAIQLQHPVLAQWYTNCDTLMGASTV